MMHCIGQILATRGRSTASPRQKLLAEKRTHPLIEIDGISDSRRGHCRRVGISLEGVYYRMKTHSMSFEEALKANRGCHIKHEVEGLVDTLVGHCDRRGLKVNTVRRRIARGMSIADAVAGDRQIGVWAFGVFDTKVGHCRRHGIKRSTVLKRMKTMSLEKALSIPVMKKSKEAAR